MTAIAERPTDLRTLTDDDLVARYGCDRFTSTILSSRLQYIISHICNKLLTTAFSPIIRDFHDFTATVSGGPSLEYLTPAVAQTLPVFFGSMRDAVANSVEEFGVHNLQEGDLLICNDPYRAGTHPNDMCFMRPVFVDGEIVSVLSIRAHMLDIGGPVPGGFSGTKRDVYENGLVVPPMLLFHRNRPVRPTFSVVLDNARFGGLLMPDMQSIFLALKLGEDLIRDTIDRYGLAAFHGSIRYACDASAERARHALRELPDGIYEGVDYLDCDGADAAREYRVAVKITKRGDRAEVDFSGTSEQGRTSLNSCWPDTKTAVSLALKALLDPCSPYTSAFLRDIDIVVPSGTLISAEPPAAAMFYWEPILTVYSAILNALNDALGTRAQAAPSRGTHVHHVVSPPDAPVPWMTALNPVGGWGANDAGDADSGQMSISMNFFGVDIETVEADIPVVHLRKEYLTDTAGAGRYRGGAGTIEDTYWPTAVHHFMTAPRTKTPNGQGALGGTAGGAFGIWSWSDYRLDGQNLSILDVAPALRDSTPISGMMDSRTHELDEAGEFFHWGAQDPWPTTPNSLWRTRSDGGGGWGDPFDRDPTSVARDVRDGYVSVTGAERDYGVIVTGDPETDPEGVAVDVDATAACRAARVPAQLRDVAADQHDNVAPTREVVRNTVEGTCEECGAGTLAEYPVLTESGWLRVVKCQSCLHSASRTKWNRLGSIQLIEDLI